MEWRFGVTCSNSELEEVGRTFLQVKLQLDVGGGRMEEKCIEMTLPQFYEFLKEMEKAHVCMNVLGGA